MVRPEPTAAARDHLRQVARLADSALAHLDDAIPGLPAYSCEAGRFLRAEAAVCRRRLGNLRKVLGDVED